VDLCHGGPQEPGGQEVLSQPREAGNLLLKKHRAGHAHHLYEQYGRAKELKIWLLYPHIVSAIWELWCCVFSSGWLVRLWKRAGCAFVQFGSVFPHGYVCVVKINIAHALLPKKMNRL
jgi:hypothetical protein